MPDPIEELQKKLEEARGGGTGKTDLSTPKAVLAYWESRLWDLVYDGHIPEDLAEQLTAGFRAAISGIVSSGGSLESQMSQVRQHPFWQWIDPKASPKALSYRIKQYVKGYQQSEADKAQQRQTLIQNEVMQSQFNLDRQREQQLREQMMGVGGGSFQDPDYLQNLARAPERREELPTEFGAPPDPSEEIRKALEGAPMSANALAYWQSNYRDIYEPLTAARQLWWDTIQGARARASQQVSSRTKSELRAARARTTIYAPGYSPEDQLQDLIDQAAAVGMTIDEPAVLAGLRQEAGVGGTVDDDTAEREGLIEAEGWGYGQRGAKQARLEMLRNPPADPLKAYLASFPFQEKFLQRTPRQRGFHPGRFSPIAIWR